MRQSVKLSDVARRAGVSIPTVSRVINGAATVDPELRDRVQVAVRELGYQPNRLAKSLRSQRTGIVAHLTAGNTAVFHTTLAQGVQDAAFDRGYTMILGNSGTPERESAYARIFEGYHVEGMIVVPTSDHDPYLEELSTRLPIVEVDRTFGSYSRYAVLLDNHGAITDAVEHLASLGHRRIALVYGVEPVSTEVERKQGYLDAMAKLGLRVIPELVVGDDFTEEGGRRAFTKLFALPQPPTALIVTTNEALAGVVLAARAAGVRIPAEVSIIGMDDARWAQMTDPPLSVMDQPAYRMGYEAAMLLIACINGNQDVLNSHRIRRLPAQLLLRGSTAVPKGG